MTNKTYPVFVYGTLKIGFPNFRMNTGTYSGRCKTRDCYPLYLVGSRWSPWLLSTVNEGYQVDGQLFMLDDQALFSMDQLERVSFDDGYRRVQLAVICEQTGQELLAYSYVKSPGQLHSPDIRLGPLSGYDIDHATRYKPRTPAGDN